MKLQTISVSNHSRFENVKLEVREHCVIVGPNDVGKTSLLRILNLLLGCTPGQISQQLSIADLRDPTQPLSIEATLSEFSDDERAAFPNEIDISATDQIESLNLRLDAEVDQDQPESLI